MRPNSDGLRSRPEQFATGPRVFGSGSGAEAVGASDRRAGPVVGIWSVDGAGVGVLDGAAVGLVVGPGDRVGWPVGLGFTASQRMAASAEGQLTRHRLKTESVPARQSVRFS